MQGSRMLDIKVIQAARFDAPVEVTVPTAEGDVAMSFTAHFKALGAKASAAHDLATTAGTLSFFEAALVGWEGIVGEDGEPLAFSAEAREALTDSEFVTIPLYQAYRDGLAQARRGN